MRNIATSVAMLALLAACGDQEVLLPGERLDIAGLPDTGEVVNRSVPVALPPATVNAEWSHVGGNARHQLPHPALGRSLSRVWSASIGQGADRRHRITADPVVSSGRIFTMDSRATVSAHSTGGAALWSRDLTPPTENANEASGGGIAASGGRVYVTTGFGTLTALDAASGAVAWMQDLDAAATGAPTVADGVVYLVTRDDLGWAIDAASGRVLWQILGATSNSGLAGGPSPAVADAQVIFPFSSGQMIAAVRSTGTQTWAGSVAGERTGRAFSRYADLSGEPVVSGGTVYAASHAGRAAAFDVETGLPLWQANEGAMNPPAVIGGSMFMVTDENRLARLDASTGQTVWVVDLPFYRRPRLSRRETAYVHFGPVLAGGRLIVASDDGLLREFDPASGALLGTVDLPGSAVRNPVVAGGTLYLVTENGELHAFR